ncbi:MAG: beta-lactamase family protein [Bacteroidetes bacterium]|nr:beta-lactamase family protein [Bacteroidota bacterium]
MKSLFTITLLIFITLSITFSCKKKDTNPDPAIQAAIDAAVTATRLGVEAEIGKAIPNLNIYIQTPEGSWFSSSAGEGYQPITADTYFRFASNTKNFTSASILNMQEDGWVNLDDKITDLIPGSNIPYVPATDMWDIPYKDQITIKMLLNHSAGVYDVDNDSVPGYSPYSYTAVTQYYEPNHQFTAEEMVNQLTINQLSYFEPGTGQHYSNTGYAIAGEIVGRIYSFHAGTTKHLSDYLSDYIVGESTPVPLDIRFPYLASDQDLPSPYSCGHVLVSATETNEICSYNMSAQVAEGNGYTTMKNLNTYIRTLMKGENVLTAASVEMMKHDVSTASPTYGLGCFYNENLGYGHNGARVGNMTLMMYDPELDISLITYISAIDEVDFLKTYFAITDVAYAVREAMGYPGKPQE